LRGRIFDLNHENPLHKSDLRPGKPDAVFGVHGGYKFPGDLQVFGADVLYRLGFLPEQVVPQGQHLPGGQWGCGVDFGDGGFAVHGTNIQKNPLLGNAGEWLAIRKTDILSKCRKKKKIQPIPLNRQWNITTLK
jgi:hypothetical protein